ncbi:zinc metallo ase nas-4-like, partial [Paramuricea clavata]
KMDANMMDSMGYAYDYESIMHYGRKFFTSNGKDTIRVRRRPGLGNVSLGHVNMGQRKRLSDIDVAQINAMYNCNKIATPTSAKCIKSKTKDGRDYNGMLSYTEKGVTCQSWNSNYPHRNAVVTHNYHSDYKMGLMVKKNRDHYMYHNYCRNPQGKRKRPWCYTTKTKPKWQYCDLKIC